MANEVAKPPHTRHILPMSDTPKPQPPLQAAIVPVTAFQQNCSLIWCTKTMRGAFVDPGGDLDRKSTRLNSSHRP